MPNNITKTRFFETKISLGHQSNEKIKRIQVNKSHAFF